MYYFFHDENNKIIIVVIKVNIIKFYNFIVNTFCLFGK